MWGGFVSEKPPQREVHVNTMEKKDSRAGKELASTG